jgi:hypothetical protein
MLAPQLRQKIFSLWTSFWSSGMSNPIVAIEQITYLLFLNQLEEQDKTHVEKGKDSLFDTAPNAACRWSVLKTKPTQEQYEENSISTSKPNGVKTINKDSRCQNISRMLFFNCRKKKQAL